MHFDYGYSEEKQVGKTYDINLLKRLYPFIKPYISMLAGSMILVIFITGVELSLPYITKVAIDRYIMPHSESMDPSIGGIIKDKKRYLKVDTTREEFREIIKKYPKLFEIHQPFAFIHHENLNLLDKKDLQILRKDDVSGLKNICILFIAFILINFFLNFFQVIIMEYTGQMAMHDLRTDLFKHIIDLPVTFFALNPVARLVTRVTNDVQNMYELFTSIITFVLKDFFLLIGIAILLILINWQLALISFSIIPFVLYISIYFSGLARDIFRDLRTKLAEINGRFAETTEGIKVIQLFLQEKENYQSFTKLNHENYTTAIKQIHIFALFMPLIEILASVALAIIIYYGGGRVVSETLSLGSLVAFISYIKMFFTPLRDIAEKYNIMQNAMASAERLFMILDDENIEDKRITADGRGEAPLKKAVINRIDSVEFENVSFMYVKNEPVFEKISFKIKKKEKFALVGPTGSGKTSLINLILRFHIPDSGRILINGADINTFDLSELRSKIAIVTQEPFLFSGTIRENIVPSGAEISEEVLKRLLKASGCSSLISRLTKGLETRLSEGGKSLSSGQRQLISIARAFIYNPDLLLLDEATSYIDSKTEEEITLALASLMKNRTCLVVAHRLSTARNSDRIMVLSKGKIIESGTHHYLMKQGEFYYKLNHGGAELW